MRYSLFQAPLKSDLQKINVSIKARYEWNFFSSLSWTISFAKIKFSLYERVWAAFDFSSSSFM